MAHLQNGLMYLVVLFLVYINDMPDDIAVLIKLYADDAEIYSRVSATSPSQFK